MSDIITIGREFGSGGREFGRRLADLLHIDYYDQEIVSEIAKSTQLAEEYVHSVMEKKPHVLYPITIGRSIRPDMMSVPQVDRAIYTEQSRILKEMASKSSCVIVGRCADEILKAYHPLRIFVYADVGSRIERCQSRHTPEETYTDKEWQQKIMEIDKGRSKYYEFYTGKKWGDKQNYDICINTKNIDIKGFVAHFAKFYLMWNQKGIDAERF